MLSRQKNLSKVIDVTSLYIARACPSSEELIDSTTDLAVLLAVKNDNLRHLRTVSALPFFPRMVLRLTEFTDRLSNKSDAA